MVARGDGLIIPPLSIVAEFNILDDNKDIKEEDRLSVVHQSLSWPALSEYHLSLDFLASAVDCCQALLDNSCCSAEASQFQSVLQAWGVDYVGDGFRKERKTSQITIETLCDTWHTGRRR